MAAFLSNLVYLEYFKPTAEIGPKEIFSVYPYVLKRCELLPGTLDMTVVGVCNCVCSEL